MNPIARDLAALRRATRDAELDEREVHLLETTASMADLQTVEMWCSILEKVREAGYLQREHEANDEGVFIHKGPNDWGVSAR